MQWNTERWYISLGAVYYFWHTVNYFYNQRIFKTSNSNMKTWAWYISNLTRILQYEFASKLHKTPQLYMVSTFKSLGKQKPVAAISKLLTYLGEPWLLSQHSDYNFELTHAYELSYACKILFSFLLAEWYVIRVLFITSWTDPFEQQNMIQWREWSYWK